MRALLVALDDWADRGIAPPESEYPDTRRGTLATIEEVARTFPAIPGVTFPVLLTSKWVEVMVGASTGGAPSGSLSG